MSRKYQKRIRTFSKFRENNKTSPKKQKRIKASSKISEKYCNVPWILGKEQNIHKIS